MYRSQTQSAVSRPSAKPTMSRSSTFRSIRGSPSGGFVQLRKLLEVEDKEDEVVPLHHSSRRLSRADTRASFAIHRPERSGAERHDRILPTNTASTWSFACRHCFVSPGYSSTATQFCSTSTDPLTHPMEIVALLLIFYLRLAEAIRFVADTPNF